VKKKRLIDRLAHVEAMLDAHDPQSLEDRWKAFDHAQFLQLLGEFYGERFGDDNGKVTCAAS